MGYIAKKWWYVDRSPEICKREEKSVKKEISEKITTKYYPSADKAMIGKKIYHGGFGHGEVISASGNYVMASFSKNGKTVRRQLNLEDKI